MLELAALKLLHYQLPLSHLAPENTSPAFHLFFCLYDCPEGVVLVFPEQGTVRTKSLFVSQADNLQVFVVQSAFFSFWRRLGYHLSHFFGRLFRPLRYGGCLSFLDNLGQRDIFREILKVSLLQVFLMATMLANKNAHGCLRQ